MFYSLVNFYPLLRISYLSSRSKLNFSKLTTHLDLPPGGHRPQLMTHVGTFLCSIATVRHRGPRAILKIGTSCWNHCVVTLEPLVGIIVPCLDDKQSTARRKALSTLANLECVGLEYNALLL
jgi:hypothetical protein